MRKENQNGEEINISLEIEGRYDNVMSKLRTDESVSQYLDPLHSDLRAVIDTVVRTGGGTRSVLTDDLPEDMVASYDAEELVSLLTVLQKYDLVVLEGNTWLPGPALETDATGE
jgi:hypothetical protein